MHISADMLNGIHHTLCDSAHAIYTYVYVSDIYACMQYRIKHAIMPVTMLMWHVGI